MPGILAPVLDDPRPQPTYLWNGYGWVYQRPARLRLVRNVLVAEGVVVGLLGFTVGVGSLLVAADTISGRGAATAILTAIVVGVLGYLASLIAGYLRFERRQWAYRLLIATHAVEVLLLAGLWLAELLSAQPDSTAVEFLVVGVAAGAIPLGLLIAPSTRDLLRTVWRPPPG